MPAFRATTTFGHAGVQGMCHSQSYANLINLCTCGNDVIQAQATSKGYVWVCGPIAARIYVDVCDSNYRQRQCTCLGSRLTPEAALVPLGHLPPGPCRPGWPTLLPRAMFTSGPKLWLGACLSLWSCCSQDFSIHIASWVSCIELLTPARSVLMPSPNLHTHTQAHRQHTHVPVNIINK